MINKIFGDFKVIELSHITPNYTKIYKLQCIKCGSERFVQMSRINDKLMHSNKHCKNYIEKYDINLNKINGDRQIVKLHSITPQGYRYITKCLVCGRIKDEYISNFDRNFGILHENCTRLIIKDKYFKRLNKIHSCIIQRTTNSNYNEFFYYGGRGINICDRWKLFINFYDDMYDSYKEHCDKFGENNTSIDRINVNSNYEQANCRWATNKEQANNKRNKMSKELIIGKND